MVKRIDSPTLVISKEGDKTILVQKTKLLVVSGPFQGREFALSQDMFSIGSGPHCDLVLNDPSVSRRHCEIQLVPEGYMIRDLGSTNGTFVQGVKITEGFLGNGTECQLGKTRFIFCPLRESTEYGISPNESYGAMIGKSVAMRRSFYLAETYAPTDTTILIEGETGTGKEVMAEEIHRHSKRKDQPFIVVDCATLSRELVESELFGHTKGSFTGANNDRVGVFEHAGGGTVFLDEIGDLSPDLQPKLLRVIEKKEIRRIGSNEARKVDVRIVSATNRRLDNEVNAGRFREDLYFRLSVVRIELAPLRRRKEDIPPLTAKFLRDLHGENAMKEVMDFDRTMDAFKNHDWPGNVRELRNLVEIAFVGERRPVDLMSYLYLSRLNSRGENSKSEHNADRPFKDAKNDLIKDFERSYIQDVLRRNDGNISKAALEAGIERTYLQRLIRKNNLSA